MISFSNIDGSVYSFGFKGSAPEGRLYRLPKILRVDTTEDVNGTIYARGSHMKLLRMDKTTYTVPIDLIVSRASIIPSWAWGTGWAGAEYSALLEVWILLMSKNRPELYSWLYGVPGSVEFDASAYPLCVRNVGNTDPFTGAPADTQIHVYLHYQIANTANSSQTRTFFDSLIQVAESGVRYGSICAFCNEFVDTSNDTLLVESGSAAVSLPYTASAGQSRFYELQLQYDPAVPKTGSVLTNYIEAITTKSPDIYVYAATSVGGPSVTYAIPANRLVAAMYASASCIVGDFIYVVGGVGPSATCTRYNKSTEFTSTAIASFPYTVYSHTVTASQDGRIFCFGGVQSGVLSNRVYEYIPSSDTWVPRANMPTPSRSHVSACLPNGKIYIIGGLSAPGVMRTSIFEYDPATDAWINYTTSNYSRNEASCAVMDGRIVVGFGTSTSSPTSYTNLIDEMYFDGGIPRMRNIMTVAAAGAGFRAGAILPLTDSTLLAVAGAGSGIAVGGTCMVDVVGKVSTYLGLWSAFTGSYNVSYPCSVAYKNNNNLFNVVFMGGAINNNGSTRSNHIVTVTTTLFFSAEIHTDLHVRWNNAIFDSTNRVLAASLQFGAGKLLMIPAIQFPPGDVLYPDLAYFMATNAAVPNYYNDGRPGMNFGEYQFMLIPCRSMNIYRIIGVPNKYAYDFVPVSLNNIRIEVDSVDWSVVELAKRVDGVFKYYRDYIDFPVLASAQEIKIRGELSRSFFPAHNYIRLNLRSRIL